MDCLSFQAGIRPDAPAVIEGGRSYSFAEIQAETLRVCTRLAALELPPGAIVAVEWESLFRHMVLLSALEALGLAHASFRTDAPIEDCQEILEHADFVLSATTPPTGVARSLVLDEAWWAEETELPDASPADRVPPDRLQRLLTSSGTTGMVKTIALTRAQMDHRIAMIQWSFGYRPGTRLLLCMPFTFQAAHLQAVTCLRAGGTCCAAEGPDFWATLASSEATHSLALPYHFTALATRASDQAINPALILAAYGGGIPAGIREIFQRTVPQGRLIETYATNETGTLGNISPDGQGTIAPDSAIEIVDAQGTPLPPAEEGLIRVRRKLMPDGYIFDPLGSLQRFKQGWFYPGDIGILDGPGRFRLVGRMDDQLNVGGLKYPAQQLESLLDGLTGIRESCVLAKPGTAGVSEICIGLVLEDGITVNDKIPEIRTTLPRLAGEVRVFALDTVPRTTSGKIRRNIVLQALNAQEGR